MIIVNWLEAAIRAAAKLAPEGTHLSNPQIIHGLLAVALACLICGAVGSMVVCNRMAFFSDALAHCTFAGVALGLLIFAVTGLIRNRETVQWGILSIMVVFCILIGLAIAYVREKTALASDTVIGVFFAGAVGLGAMLFNALPRYTNLTPEKFLFGDPIYVGTEDVLLLIFLTLLTFGILAWIYNQLVFTSFNASLARSRQISSRLCNYLFIALLALIVNLCLTTFGALLINGMLIVPAATAGLLCRNMRQLFWLSIGLSLTQGILGAWLAMEVGLPDPKGGEPIYFNWGGTILVLSVTFFFVSMAARPWLRGRQTS